MMHIDLGPLFTEVIVSDPDFGTSPDPNAFTVGAGVTTQSAGVPPQVPGLVCECEVSAGGGVNCGGIEQTTHVETNSSFPDVLNHDLVGSLTGSFMLAWGGALGGGKPLRARAYRADHQPYGPAFSVESGTEGFDPALGQRQDGGFALTWVENPCVGGCQRIRGRDMDFEGTPETPVFPVHTDVAFTHGNQALPDVADLNGVRIYAWESHAINADGHGRGIFGRFFAGDVAASDEFRISQEYRLNQEFVRVAPGPGHVWVAAWQMRDPLSIDETRSFFRIWDGPVPLTDDIEVMPTLGFHNERPDIATNHLREIVVIWQSQTFSAGGVTELLMRRFGPDGTPTSIPLRVDGALTLNTEISARVRTPFEPRSKTEFSVGWLADPGGSSPKAVTRTFLENAPLIAPQVLASPVQLQTQLVGASAAYLLPCPGDTITGHAVAIPGTSADTIDAHAIHAD